MLNNYLLKLSNLRTGGGKANPKPHKICMMLAVSDLIAAKIIGSNRIEFNDALKNQFSFWFKRLASGNDSNTPDNPYFHLLSEGFWHLQSFSGDAYSESMPSKDKSHVLKNTEFAFLDSELYEYFSSPFTRTRLNDALLSNLSKSPSTTDNRSEFQQWLSDNGKSEKTSKSYAGALSRRLSQIAEMNGVYNGSLLTINDSSEFDRVDIGLRQLEEFIELDSKGNNMYGSSLNAYSQFLKSRLKERDDLEEILQSPTLKETEKEVLTKARTGQGIYRKNLLKYWSGKCAVTGVSNERLLIASHIKPWRDSNNEERIDFYNGLLLTPNLDKTFDLGFISFDENGQIIIGPQLEAPERLGIFKSMRVALAPNHHGYLEYHRETYFRQKAQ